MTEQVGPAPTRTLMAVIQQYEEEGRATVRGVAKRCGRGLSSTWKNLWTLRRLGLVTWEFDQQATLRPLVRRVL